MLPDFLQTQRSESRQSKFFRWGMNCFPVIFGTGVKIMFMSSDWHEVHIRLGINIWSRNYVGTIYGGSLFSAADSFYMIMLSKIFGKDFVVWDKAAAIRFKRPGTERIYAKFLLTEEQVADIKSQVEQKGEIDFMLHVNWLNKDGKVIAEIDRTMYAATKTFYKEKLAKRNA